MYGNYPSRCHSHSYNYSYVYMYRCCFTYMIICLYVLLCMCVYIYIYTHSSRHRLLKRGAQTPASPGLCQPRMPVRTSKLRGPGERRSKRRGGLPRERAACTRRHGAILYIYIYIYTKYDIMHNTCTIQYIYIYIERERDITIYIYILLCIYIYIHIHNMSYIHSTAGKGGRRRAQVPH